MKSAFKVARQKILATFCEHQAESGGAQFCSLMDTLSASKKVSPVSTFRTTFLFVLLEKAKVQQGPGFFFYL